MRKYTNTYIIKDDNRNKYYVYGVGYFNTEEEAIEARNNCENQ